jgi:hypothetical protein
MPWPRRQRPFQLLTFDPLHASMQTGNLQAFEAQAESPCSYECPPRTPPHNQDVRQEQRRRGRGNGAGQRLNESVRGAVAAGTQPDAYLQSGMLPTTCR